MKKQTFSSKSLKCARNTNPTENEDMSNEKITELELIDNLGNKTVKKMTLIQGEDEKFSILVQLSWKGGELLLETQRKTPRVWSSLDRLIKHINSKYGQVPLIELKLRSNEDGKHDSEDG
ncbi:hypothetical protein RFJ04_004404 [Klebsiella variicola]|nr:hypothetical protein [Salmonella enterica]EJH2158570.1 hypothetical protein [Salmonella enterica]EKC5142237.1 hypothetical protein [Salmonella enterica]ELA2926340.1 hypothetical protein [Klebsiella variicola]